MNCPYHGFHTLIQQRANLDGAVSSRLFSRLISLIVATILTKPIRIYRTAHVWRSGIVSATQIADDIANTLDILLFWISGCAFVKSGIGAIFRPC
jgi:hypothetical protein